MTDMIEDLNKSVSDDTSKANLQAAYLDNAVDAQSKSRAAVAFNPEAQQLANNGFALLGAFAQGIGQDGGKKNNQPERPPVADEPDKEQTPMSVTGDDDGRVIETTNKQGVTTKYDYKEDGTLEAQQFSEDKPLGETKKYPNGKVDNDGTLTWHDETTSYIERLDGYAVKRNSKDGRILETTNTDGITTKYSYRDDGILEARQFAKGKEIGETKKYANGKVDEQGTLTWHDDKTDFLIRLDGHREERNRKDGSTKIYYAEGAYAEARRDEKGTHTTTFSDQINKIKVAEKTEFALPQNIKLIMPSGEKEFQNVISISTFYNPETGKPVAQNLEFAPPGYALGEKALAGELKGRCLCLRRIQIARR